MQEAGLPDNEARRIATLQGLDILDTPREDRFDRYTCTIARAFDMPVALISLVDGSRQWFKSAVGIDRNETSRDVSFCGHAILGDGIFEVRNARLDPRFRDNPLVVGPPRIRFYAGAPLKASNGERLGTLCVIDRIPRELSEDEKTMLKTLADMVVGEIMRKVDAEADRSDRVTHAISGAEFFDSIADERDPSVLLFDIDDVLASHDDENSVTSPGEIFARLLHDHFPTARSIAHIGNYHFCVLLGPDEGIDEVKAINGLCSAAKNLLCFAEGHLFLTPFVGRLQYDPDRYATVDDMLVDAERMFLSHERQPVPHETDIKQLLKKLLGWRETIF
ncbi:MAG: GAF domain-containing protein [Gammaproteobacteria bacterium]|nr:GAF domain-containing protein [Gammaproteobacteria bacterium]